MDQVQFEEAIQQCLASLLSDRLCILCGAGLSMAAPSNLPSAWVVAQGAKEQYEATFGQGRAPLSEDIEEQAQFFFERHELDSIYFKKLIDPHAFAGKPNPGHIAVADLLLVHGIKTAVSTNVDTLVESAGNQLFGQVGVCLDGHQAASLGSGSSPYLKIHGCRQSDFENMVWAPGQIEIEPVQSRIENSATWLKAQLLGKDLLVVGFWTDWNYLQNVLESTIGEVSPSKVFVVDPAETNTLETKAPGLYNLGERASTSSIHIKASGSDFLDSLRVEYSKNFVGQAILRGRPDFEAGTGLPVDPKWCEITSSDATQLWSLRRDIEGCKPNQPASMLNPPNEALYGATVLQLQAAGADLDYSHWVLKGDRVRVVRAANQSLARIQADHNREESQLTAPSIIIAVGAEATFLPPDIARAGTTPSVTRGSVSKWLTRPQAIEELGI